MIIRPGTMRVKNNRSTPRSLFTAGEQGVWYDPSDFSTLFQDSAGTTPVTAVEQSVGKMLDKSGRGNHATQATAGNRPVLRQDGNGCYYLAFNGTSSAMATGSIDFTSTDKMTVFAGLRKLSDAVTGIVAELSASSFATSGTFSMRAPSATASSFGATSCGSITGILAAEVLGITAPSTNVLTSLASISADQNTLRVNGALTGTQGADQGTGNYGNYPLYIGARAGTSLFFNGNLYSMIVRAAQSSGAQITSAETYVNGKTKAY